VNEQSGNRIVPGGEAIFVLIVDNHGPDSAEAVTLTDKVPTGTSFVSFTAPPGWSKLALPGPRGGIGSVIATAAGRLAPGAYAFLLTVRVNPAVRAGTVIFDTARVASGIRDPNPKNNVFSRSFLVS
jgi:uncharacterized repeat protein (TIGR01451 family)